VYDITPLHFCSNDIVFCIFTPFLRTRSAFMFRVSCSRWWSGRQCVTEGVMREFGQWVLQKGGKRRHGCLYPATGTSTFQKDHFHYSLNQFSHPEDKGQCSSKISKHSETHTMTTIWKPNAVKTWKLVHFGCQKNKCNRKCGQVWGN